MKASDIVGVYHHFKIALARLCVTDFYWPLRELIIMSLENNNTLCTCEQENETYDVAAQYHEFSPIYNSE